MAHLDSPEGDRERTVSMAQGERSSSFVWNIFERDEFNPAEIANTLENIEVSAAEEIPVIRASRVKDELQRVDGVPERIGGPEEKTPARPHPPRPIEAPVEGNNPRNSSQCASCAVCVVS
mmetsp:Transcript_51259/g.95316  ORF Transcript_51259/g.95316 Transcript_51259/m.95316 type:complete len:120 (+) Transcript_51259:34-393(+)